MQIDAAMIGVVVTVLLALIGMAYGYGILTQKVKSNRCDIADIWKEFKSYQIDNRQDHKEIFVKLDKIISNGKKS